MRGHERLQVICIEEIDHGVLIIYSVDVSEVFRWKKRKLNVTQKNGCVQKLMEKLNYMVLCCCESLRS